MSTVLKQPKWLDESQYRETPQQKVERERLMTWFTGHAGQRRLIVLDPSLHSPVGHHFSHDRSLILAAKRQNIPAIVVGFKDCEERVMAELPVLRHFDIHPYAKPDIRMTAEEDFSVLNEIFLHCLLKLPFKLTAQDVVLFPTVNQNQLLAIPAWMLRLSAQNEFPQVVVGLMFGPKWISWTEKDSDQPALYARAFRSWPAALRNRLRIICETDGLGREYSALSGLPVSVRPAPTTSFFQNVPPLSVQCASGEKIVGYMGHARREKGVHHLPGIARFNRLTTPEIRYRIQLNYTTETVLEREATQGLSEVSTVFPLTLGPLEEENYAKFIDQCHVMLLPYSPVRYKARGSGLLREALQRGRPVVVPGDTEMGEYVTRLGVGTTFARYQPASIAHAVSQAVRNYASLRAAAEHVAEQADPVREADDYLNHLMKGT